MIKTKSQLLLRFDRPGMITVSRDRRLIENLYAYLTTDRGKVGKGM